MIYIFVVHPIAVALIHPEVNILDYVMNGIKTFVFLDGTGPLWFVLALMIFTGIYVMARIAWGYLATKLHHIDDMNPFRTRSLGNNYSGFGLINRLSILRERITISGVLTLTLLIGIPAFLIRTVMPMGSAWFNLQFPFLIVAPCAVILSCGFTFFCKENPLHETHLQLKTYHLPNNINYHEIFRIVYAMSFPYEFWGQLTKPNNLLGIINGLHVLCHR